MGQGARVLEGVTHGLAQDPGQLEIGGSDALL
jgi:hypothetical protein